jgi:hypothetical protein
MKTASLVLWFVIGFSLSLLLALPAYPHGGGLDAYGCHHNRKAGGYHCHRGPLAGQSFASQDEMLKKISAEKASATKKNVPAKQ